MVVNDFDIVGIAVVPIETYSPLIVDPNAVEVSTVTLQSLQAVTGRYSKVVEILCVLDDHQFSLGLTLDVFG